ncbi:hypothetical protein AYI68_g7130 [Smittium mucronatum]|uniref:Uncharacterized protein n=1 Tax=Smittium mucronatum TaxID=133383 RepID=A0A1R0GPJ9_9FUNG|nr:hypothetical protein AYI68_g7130 [Smittium mucronatum]
MVIKLKNRKGLSVPSLPDKKRDFRFARLKPGFSPLDWARLKASGTDLRGVHSRGGRRTQFQKGLLDGHLRQSVQCDSVPSVPPRRRIPQLGQSGADARCLSRWVPETVAPAALRFPFPANARLFDCAYSQPLWTN